MATEGRVLSEPEWMLDEGAFAAWCPCGGLVHFFDAPHMGSEVATCGRCQSDWQMTVTVRVTSPTRT